MTETHWWTTPVTDTNPRLFSAQVLTPLPDPALRNSEQTQLLPPRMAYMPRHARLELPSRNVDRGRATVVTYRHQEEIMELEQKRTLKSWVLAFWRVVRGW